MTTPTAYLVGLDLGQKNDYTALSVLRQREREPGEFDYGLIHLDRWRGRPYHEVPAIVEQVESSLHQHAHDAARQAPRRPGPLPDPDYSIHTIVDSTGVGIAVVDSIRAGGVDCVAVTIHGGDAVSGGASEYRVPKRELVGTLQVLLQNRRLAISDQLEHADILQRELENFRAKISLKTGHDTYGAGEEWRDGNHDDLVLSVALAAWYGEYVNPLRSRRQVDGIIDSFLDELE